MAKPASTRDQLLDAAIRLVLDQGGAALTLDAVARLAGVSKGGLLYHFPSKDALIVGLIDRLCAEFDAALEAELARAEGPPAGRWLRTYIRLCFAPSDRELAFSAALLAAGAFNPELLTPLRERFAAWQRRAESDGVDPALATALRLAADGLWFDDLAGLVPLSAERRAAVRDTLLRLAQGA
jgi:AcrR family transcriptional regulator